MYPRVTAIVVAQSGGPRLQRTLDALTAQTRQPDAVIAVDCASTDDAARILAEANPTQILQLPEKVAFGAAVATAVRILPPATSPAETLWLLAQDTEPEPEALQTLLAALEVSPSVAVVGPKLVDDDDPGFIREFGEAMTPFGASMPLVENELDQAQHDGLSDVLAVSSAGMLVRQSLWEQLDGFDPALPTVDDGLDFCVRARLAGFRVTLVAPARIRLRGDGLAGPNLSTKWTVRRRLAGERRRAQLHRRMVYAPGWAIVLHWLTLVPLAILRSIVRLLRKEPGSIGGELAAAFRVAFSGMVVSNARRRLARSRSVGWAAIAPLRIPFAEVRRTRALKREAALVGQQGERHDLDFFGTGGGWTVLAALMIGFALFVPVLGSGGIGGGGLLPLDASVGRLWADLGYGWRDINLGFTGAADPFGVVLAVLGTLTFWQPSTSVLVLFVLAVPLAALGAWFAAARLTARSTLRAFGALAYALAPTLLLGLQEGRPAAVLAHVLLPWLFFTGLAARRSWAGSAVTALIAAATVACAPVLIPALVVAWIAAIVFAKRHAARIVFIPLPALVLFLPVVLQQAARGAWLSIFADPGVPLAARQTPAWQLALGFPDGLLGGWHTLAAQWGLPEAAPNVLVPMLLAPLGVLAVLALFLRGTVRAVVALLVALAGFVTAVAALHVEVAVAGSTTVPIWPGSAVSLYWLGLIGAAVIGLSALGRVAVAPAWIAIVTLIVVAAPLPIALHDGSAAVAGSDGRTMPAVVVAKAATQPRTGTLVMTPQPDGGIRATVVRGSGVTLDDQSTLSSTERSLGPRQDQLAGLAGNLASRSGYDPAPQLAQLGIDFVLLTPSATALHSPDSADAAAVAEDESGTESVQAAATRGRASIALDANAVLSPVGNTPSGQLWAFDRGTSAVPTAARIPADAGGVWRILIVVVQGLVIGVTALMAIPTARSADRVAELHARRAHRGREERDPVDPDGAAEPGDVVEPDDGHDVAGERDAPDELSRPDEPTIAAEKLDDWEAEPDPEANVEAADQPQPPSQLGPESADERAGDATPDGPAAWATVGAPTTLEDGLEETIIRPWPTTGDDRG